MKDDVTSLFQSHAVKFAGSLFWFTGTNISYTCTSSVMTSPTGTLIPCSKSWTSQWEVFNQMSSFFTNIHIEHKTKNNTVVMADKP